jgi:hypothetical protein
MIFRFSTGWVVDHLGYAPILIASGLLVPIGTMLLFWSLRPARQADAVPI